MKLINKIVAAGALFAATHANAAVIDFTSAAWSAANNQASYSVAGPLSVTTTVTAGPAAAGAKLSYFTDDGLGVTGTGYKEPDEIDPNEYIEITFSTDIMLASIDITDFFDKYKDGGDGSTANGEQGYLKFWLDGLELATSPLTFFGDDSDQVNGEQTITVNPWAKVDKIKFYTLAKNDDFSIKGLEYFLVPDEQTNVPEPSIAVLLGLGLMGLGLSRRRQAKKA